MLTSQHKSSKTLYVFIDESGNVDFGENGTNHFVLAGVFTFNPVEVQSTMQSLRYNLMQDGYDISEFHASHDRQSTRNRVFELLNEGLGVHAHVVHVKKSLIDTEFRTETRIHAYLGVNLVSAIVLKVGLENFDRLVLVFDHALTRKHQAEFSLKVKPVLKSLGRPFHLYFQSMKTDMNGQIADYVAWAKFRDLERGDTESWQKIVEALSPSSQELSR